MSDFIPSIWLAPGADRGHYSTAVSIWPRSLFDRGHYLTAVTIWPRSLFDRGRLFDHGH